VSRAAAASGLKRCLAPETSRSSPRTSRSLLATPARMACAARSGDWDPEGAPCALPFQIAVAARVVEQDIDAPAEVDRFLNHRLNHDCPNVGMARCGKLCLCSRLASA